MQRTIVALCLALAPWVASGDTIYKVQMPDGTILFTDQPPRGGKVLEQREATPVPTVRPPVRPPAPAGRAPAATPGPAPAQDANEPPRTLDAALARISDAERELAIAKRKLEAGLEPLPGERIGLAKGGSRLTPAYENRIADLERAVAVAEARVRQAYDARNALR